MDYEFCPMCGSLKERGKICKICSTIIKSSERSERINKDNQFRSTLNRKKQLLKEKSKQIKEIKPKNIIRFSESGGLDFFYEIDTDVKKTRLNYCVKCKQSKVCYAGNWVKAGGQYAPEDSRKRIFICTDCWRPSKKES